MQRILLACNAILALFLAIQLGRFGEPAAAGSRAPQAWTLADLRLLPRPRAVTDRDGERDPRTAVLLLDCGVPLFGEPVPEGPLDLGLQLLPPVRFQCFADTPRTLRIELQQPLPPSTDGELRLSRDLRDRDGRVLPAGGRLPFATPDVAIADVVVDDTAPGAASRAPALLVSLDAPIGAEQARRLLQLRDAGGARTVLPAAVELETAAGDELFRLRPHGELPAAVEVVLLPGATARGGNRPAAVERSRRVVVFEPLEVRAVLADSGNLAIQCNRTVPVPAAGVIQVEPPLPFTVQSDRRGLRLVGSFAPGRVYTVTLPAGFPGVSANDARREAGQPQLHLLREVRRTVVMPDLPPDLDFASAGSVLSTRAEPFVHLRGCNTDKVRLSLRMAYPNNAVRLLQNADDPVFAPAVTHEIAVQAPRNEAWRERVDLRPLLGGAVTGLFQLELRSDHSWWPQRRLLQLTDLGVSLRAGRDQAAVQVRGIADGAPKAGAVVDLLTPTNQLLATAVTDEQGIALLRWAPGASDRVPFAVHVRADGDQVFVGLDQYRVELADPGLGGRPYLADPAEAYVWPSRGIVRPGETFEVAALLRDAQGAAVAGQELLCRFIAQGGRVVHRQRLLSPGSGLVHAQLPLRLDAPTGNWRVELCVPAQGSAPAPNAADDAAWQALGEAVFEVAAFVPNRLEADVVALSPLRFGGAGSVRVRANWLDGAPAAGRPVVLRLRLLAGPFAVASLPGVSFASATEAAPPGELPPVEGVLDERGEAELRFALPAAGPHQTLVAHAVVEVLDPSGRAVTAVGSAPVLQPRWQLGIKASPAQAELFAVAGDTTPWQEPLSASVRLERRRHEWDHEAIGSRWRYRTRVVRDVLGEWPVTLQQGRAALALPQVAVADGWLCVVAVADGIAVEQALQAVPQAPDRLRVTGPEAAAAPGETAIVAVDAPADSSGFVTLESDTVHAAFAVALRRGRNAIEVPVPPQLRLPNLHVVVTATMPATAARPGVGPVWIVGGTALPLRRDELRLPLRVDVEAAVLPNSVLPVAIEAPGATSAVVAVIDEGVLSLTRHRDPDPVGFLLAQRRLSTRGADTGAALLADMAFQPATRSGGDGDDFADLLLAGSVNPALRPLCLFAAVALDERGQGRVAFELPEYEGRVRTMVLVAGPTGVAGVSGSTLVRAPLGLQLALPRQLAPGDRCTVPITVHNGTGAAGEATLSLVLPVGLVVEGGAFAAGNATLPLAAAQRTSIDVPLRATPQLAAAAGQLPIEVVASLNGEQRRVRATLLVRAPALPARDLVGLRLGTAQELRVADDWLPGGGAAGPGLVGELIVDHAPDRHLLPSLLSLLEYPYGCVEQTTSRGMGLLVCAALLPRLWAGEGEEPPAAMPLAQAAVDRLWSMQGHDGGFGFWGGRSNAAVTLHVVDFLLAARDAGLVVAERALGHALDRVASLARTDDVAVVAPALGLLARAGRSVQPRLDWLCAQPLGAEARAQVALVLAALGAPARARAMLVHSEGADGVAAAATTGNSLGSPLRTQALQFRCALLLDPTAAELPELAAALQAAVLARRCTTQEHAQVLRALAGYYAALPPGPAPAVSGTLDGQPLPPLRAGRLRLPVRPGSVLRLDAGGVGFALWRVTGLRSAKAAPATEPLALRRELVDLETGAVVTECRRGRVYEVRIRGSARQEVCDAVVLDVLAAGLEPEPAPPGVAADDVAANRPQDDEAAQVQPVAPANVERRDDRVLLFFTAPLRGEFVVRHRVRAVFPGVYQQPGLVAEAMYDPTFQCRTGDGPPLVIRP